MTSLQLTSTGTADFGQGDVSFIGNATTLIRFGGLTILTDPAFLHKGEHVYLGHGIWARREVEPACHLPCHGRHDDGRAGSQGCRDHPNPAPPSRSTTTTSRYSCRDSTTSRRPPRPRPPARRRLPCARRDLHIQAQRLIAGDNGCAPTTKPRPQLRM
jgi:hypothetical protein